MVIARCDRCGSEVAAPEFLYHGVFKNGVGTDIKNIVGDFCADCVDAGGDYLATQLPSFATTIAVNDEARVKKNG